MIGSKKKYAIVLILDISSMVTKLHPTIAAKALLPKPPAPVPIVTVIALEVAGSAELELSWVPEEDKRQIRLKQACISDLLAKRLLVSIPCINQAPEILSIWDSPSCRLLARRRVKQKKGSLRMTLTNDKSTGDLARRSGAELANRVLAVSSPLDWFLVVLTTLLAYPCVLGVDLVVPSHWEVEDEEGKMRAIRTSREKK
ncbi:hypothetical protein FB446DRAFT_699971 [Lentinula raphanica]|nr:hypothetical protein FB446DRAFT_699971 [Lentinula raphanica]